MEQTTIMDAKQAADYLKLKRATLYIWSRSGKMPAFRMGNRWRYRKEDLDAWIKKLSNAEGTYGWLMDN